MGSLGGSDTTNTSGGFNSNTTGTVTNVANAPRWLLKPFGNYMADVARWGNNNNGLPRANDLMQQSWRMADSLKTDPVGMAKAQQTLKGLLNYKPTTVEELDPQAALVRQGQTLANTNYSRYMNPFANQVTNRIIDDQERAREAAINNGQSEATQAGAYGGSRHGVADSLTNSEYDRNTGDMLANLRMQNFNQAQGAAQFDIGNDLSRRTYNADALNNMRQFNAGNDLQSQMFNSQQGLAGAQFRGDTAQNLGLLGIARDANARENVDQVYQAGQQKYALSPAMRALGALQARQGLLGIDPNNFLGRTMTSNETSSGTSTGTGSQGHNPGLFDWLQLGANVAGTFMSDRRLKRDITPLGSDEKGQPWYTYRYVWDDDDAPLRTGVMADEAPAHAVRRHPSGYLMVDYGAI